MGVSLWKRQAISSDYNEVRTIFRDIIRTVTQLPDAHVIHACGPMMRQEWIFERLMNRINRALKACGEYGVILSDEGKEYFFNRLRRRMAVHNYIPSKFGQWGDTQTMSKNIPIDRIIEDMFFKDSKHSYFIQ